MMKNFSRFDIIMIIAFVVVTLLGGGAAYYLDAYQLAAAQADVQEANGEFNQYTTQMVFLPTQKNLKVLRNNIDLINAQMDPVVTGILQAPDNKLGLQHNENSGDWKRKLDEQVAKLNAAAKVAGVQVPSGYYYGFSAYLSPSPDEGKTEVLSKQLLAIEELSNILIGAQVNAIKAIRRTPEENAPNVGTVDYEGDFIPGRAVQVAGGVYTAYPFNLDFDATTDSLRKVIDDIMKSPYVFIIRGISIENSAPGSPQLGDLDRIAGAQSSPSVSDSPGAVAATKSTAGPQYLFGNEILHVRILVDLIEWNGVPSQAKPASAR